MVVRAPAIHYLSGVELGQLCLIVNLQRNPETRLAAQRVEDTGHRTAADLLHQSEIFDVPETQGRHAREEHQGHNGLQEPNPPKRSCSRPWTLVGPARYIVHRETSRACACASTLLTSCHAASFPEGNFPIQRGVSRGWKHTYGLGSRVLLDKQPIASDRMMQIFVIIFLLMIAGMETRRLATLTLLASLGKSS
jgi:hypothetical protein